jgi:hypothetical protein
VNPLPENNPFPHIRGCLRNPVLFFLILVCCFIILAELSGLPAQIENLMGVLYPSEGVVYRESALEFNLWEVLEECLAVIILSFASATAIYLLYFCPKFHAALAQDFWMGPSPVLTPVNPSFTVEHQGCTLEAAMKCHYEGRVLAVKGYHGDAAATISPMDMVIGWEKMSAPLVFETLTFNQHERVAYLEGPLDVRVALVAYNTMWTQLHLIPADAAIERDIVDILPGTIVRIEGHLVHITGSQLDWPTSTSLEDTGLGACDNVWVESIRRLT